MRICFSLIVLWLLLGHTSCGYRFGRGELLQNYSTVCIPYVEGDDQGYFTALLIRSMTSHGFLKYRSKGSDLILKVVLLPPADRNIGFIYAPPDPGDNEVTNIVVANEARVSIAATFSLIDCRLGQCLIGPIEVASFLDYDFEPDLSNVNFHAFSLGQLEMHNLAQEAAFSPLYQLLAEKIVDYLNHSW